MPSLHRIAQLDQLAGGLALPVEVAELFLQRRRDGVGTREPSGDRTKPAQFHIVWRRWSVS